MRTRHRRGSRSTHAAPIASESRAGPGKNGPPSESLMLAIVENPRRPRLREHAIEVGIDALGNEELLALILETGVRGEPLELRVARLCHEAGGLAGIASRGVSALAGELGLGVARGARLA